MKHHTYIKSFISRFRGDESGAVTIDYVVLTAAAIGVSLAVLGSVSGGGMSLADRTGETVANLQFGEEEEYEPSQE